MLNKMIEMFISKMCRMYGKMSEEELIRRVDSFGDDFGLDGNLRDLIQNEIYRRCEG